MHRYRGTGFAFWYQIQAALLFNSKITDSKVCSGAQCLLVALQNETKLSLDGIPSWICPTNIDHVLFAKKTAGSWSQNNEVVTVPALCLGESCGGGCGKEGRYPGLEKYRERPLPLILVGRDFLEGGMVMRRRVQAEGKANQKFPR